MTQRTPPQASMTLGQLADVPTPVKKLHPKLAQHAAAVKAAHAHLTKTRPGFANLPATQQFAQTQRHIRRTKG